MYSAKRIDDTVTNVRKNTVNNMFYSRKILDHHFGIRRKKAISAFCLIMLLSSLLTTYLTVVYAQWLDPDLEDDQLTNNGHFRIHFTDGFPTPHPGKEVTPLQVNALDVQLEDIFDIYTDTNGDFRFNDPTRGNVLPVEVINSNGGGVSSYSPYHLELSPIIIFNDPLALEGITLHEMFHQSQKTYGWGWGSFVTEGTARMMQDKLYNDLDQSIGTEHASYRGATDTFLTQLTDNTLIDQSYRSCLFWTYFTEQFGTVTTEPQVGIDAIRVLLQNHDNGSDDVQRLNAALSTLSPGTTFQDVFMDFIVANYAKDLTGQNFLSNFPEYQYTDDNQLPGAYLPPHLTISRNMPLGDIVSGIEPMNPWSAKYYEIRPDINAPIISIDFSQKASPVDLVYNLLVIDNNDLVNSECEFNVIQKDFSKTIMNNQYDRVVVVVGALDLPAATTYSINTGGGLPTLNILTPNNNNFATVDVNDLNTFIVTLEIVGPAGVMSDLEPDDFQVTLDGTACNVVTGLEVMGSQWWLVVQPPNLTNGWYDLQIDLVQGVTDTEMNAVNFDNRVNVDSVLAIDRSGSMTEPNYGVFESTDKIYGAIDAATVYVNSYGTGDKWGLVWFSTDAHLGMSLRDFDETNRLDFITELDTYGQPETGAFALTSIGDSLDKAQDELDNRGDASHDWAIILLSDGINTASKDIWEVVGEGKRLDYWNAPVPKTRIYTVALGINADREELEKLSRISGVNTPLYVVEPASGDVPNDLVDVYRQIAEDTELEQRIAAIRGSYQWAQPVVQTIDIESGATEATFVVNCNWAGTSSPKPVITLLDPDNNEVSPTYVDDKHNLFRIPLPKSGSWTVKLERPPGEIFVFEGKYLIEVSVKSKIIFRPFLDIPLEDQKIGMGIPIVAFLTDTAPITGANVEVEITTPEKEFATAILPGDIFNLKLYDDGNHGDGEANDGVYGNIFRNTNRTTIYDVKLVAEGYSTFAGTFRREKRLAFNIKADTDSDNDGLPDTWEEFHGLNPQISSGIDGANGDPDNDGLTNEEEFANGTDPLDPDSDDGGENDGSEVSAGKDPNDPTDDFAVSFPTSLRVIPGKGYVTLVIGVLQEHDYLVVYRATNPNGPWESFEIEPKNEYVDSDLVNDVTYYYKVVGVDREEERIHFSIPTRVVSATPKIDPIPPSGFIIINKGEVRTNTEKVTLTVWADLDIKEMKISNYPDFKDAEWEPFTTTKNWTLTSGKGLRTIYLMLRDAAGNIGPRSPYDPSVDVQPATDGIILREIEGIATSFHIDALKIEPSSVMVGESVSISFNVTNTGEIVGICPVQLKIDGITQEEADVTLMPSERKTYVFSFVTQNAGTCQVDVNGLQGSFQVNEQTTWLIYVVIIAVIIIVGLFLWLLRRK